MYEGFVRVVQASVNKVKEIAIAKLGDVAYDVTVEEGEESESEIEEIKNEESENEESENEESFDGESENESSEHEFLTELLESLGVPVLELEVELEVLTFSYIPCSEGGCSFCHSEKSNDKSRFFSYRCNVMKELPSANGSVIKLFCSMCPSLVSIQNLTEPNLLVALNCSGSIKISGIQEFPNLTYLNCAGCKLLTKLPEFAKLDYLIVSHCTLLTEWKNKSENVKILSCKNCPMLHFNITLFFRFNEYDIIDNNDHFLPKTRLRNGVISRDVFAFNTCKMRYISELPSRVTLEVYQNSILYAPGGVKYLELLEFYKDGFGPAFSKRKCRNSYN